jgi:hypothetical protein
LVRIVAATISLVLFAACSSSSTSTTSTTPVVTAWLRNLFGIDRQPVGLGVDVAKQYNVGVRIEARLG